MLDKAKECSKIVRNATRYCNTYFKKIDNLYIKKVVPRATAEKKKDFTYNS